MMIRAAGADRPHPASGSSFYTAMRVLPRTRRLAMYAVYAFCRSVDDIADSDAPFAERVRELENWRTDVEALYHGRAPEHLSDLADAIQTFGLQQCDFDAIIDGMMMDASGNLIAPDWATLDLYCDRVASAVGRLSVRIFGLDGVYGEALAYHLGRALQLTNILRDLDEDASLGRLYLPREALVAAGITALDPEAVLQHPKLDEACTLVAERAASTFREANRIMAGCPRSSVRAPRLMASAYSSLLADLVARGWHPPREPVHVGRLHLIGAVLRYGFM